MEESKGEIEKRKLKLKEKLFSWMQDNYDRVFLLVLIAAFFIRLWIFYGTIDQPLWYDGASYMGAARKWGLGLQISDIWYYRRGFLFPLLGALIFKLGLGETGMRFLILLLSTGIVGISYFIIKDMFDKEKALMVTIGLTFSWVILFFTGRILTDIPAAFLVLTSLFFFYKGYVLDKGKKYLYLFAIFFAIACLTRMQTLMFAPAFFIYVILKEKTKIIKNKNLWITALIFFILLIPNFVVYYQHYGNPFTDILSHYFGVSGVSKTSDVADRTTATLFNYIKELPYILDGNSTPKATKPLFMIFLIGFVLFFYDLLLGIDKLSKNESLQKKFFILSWILIPFLILGYITEYPEHRYITACLPFLFLIISYPIIEIRKYMQKLGANKGIALFLIFSIFIGLMIFNYNWSTSLINNKRNSYIEIKETGLWLKSNSNPKDVIFSASMPQIQYYSDRTTNYYLFNKTEFEKNLTDIKPRYIMLSIFEAHPDWLFTKGNLPDGSGYMNSPFFNMTIVYNTQGQILNLDIKEEVIVNNITYRFVYPKDRMNGVFVYEAEYPYQKPLNFAI
ncbi:MAG: glycosyltransferase family 39 protein [Nanoarchaeota archaeon]|nr:glycosyltransferase family 39 protein [Nanoarchaeota archaeon]